MLPEDDQGWLEQADEDLIAAQSALQAEVALPATAAFHSHQAAVKALKAYLSSRDEAFPGIRDLPDLLDLCRELDDEFSLLQGAVETLQPYFAMYLRPARPIEPTLAGAETALELAAGVVQFVRDRL